MIPKVAAPNCGMRSWQKWGNRVQKGKAEGVIGEWSKKKVKSEDEKQAAEGPQSESELGEAAQSEMLEEIQLVPHVQKKSHDHAESMIKSEPKEEAQGAKPLLQKRKVAKLRILKGRHWD